MVNDIFKRKFILNKKNITFDCSFHFFLIRLLILFKQHGSTQSPPKHDMTTFRVNKFKNFTLAKKNIEKLRFRVHRMLFKKNIRWIIGMKILDS